MPDFHFAISSLIGYLGFEFCRCCRVTTVPVISLGVAYLHSRRLLNPDSSATVCSLACSASSSWWSTDHCTRDFSLAVVITMSGPCLSPSAPRHLSYCTIVNKRAYISTAKALFSRIFVSKNVYLICISYENAITLGISDYPALFRLVSVPSSLSRDSYDYLCCGSSLLIYDNPKFIPSTRDQFGFNN